MALRKQGKYYAAYFRDENGKVRTQSTGCTDKESAQKIERMYMQSVQSRRIYNRFMKFAEPDYVKKAKEIDELENRSPVEKKAHKRGTLALSAMFDLAGKRRRLSSFHSYAWDNFVKKVGVRYADEVTPKVALDYLNANFSAGNGKSFNNQKSALNTIFRCCLIEANLTASPFAAILNKSVTSVDSHRNMTDAEFATIFRNAGTYTQIMMMLSRYTAQRLETCARITPAMFNSDKKVFIIQPGKTKRFHKWVCVPVFKVLEEYITPVLRKCKDPDKPIVENFNYPGNKNFSSYFSALIKKLNIKDNEEGSICFHSIRGRAITWMKENGIKGEDLRAITGHASDAVEDIYSRDIETISNIAKHKNI